MLKEHRASAFFADRKDAELGAGPGQPSSDLLAALAGGDAVVLPFDQHAGPPDGIAVEFLGHPAWTFKSLAIIALATGAPVLAATSWREDDGRHVLGFGAPIAPIEAEDTNDAIRRSKEVVALKLGELASAMGLPPGLF